MEFRESFRSFNQNSKENRFLIQTIDLLESVSSYIVRKAKPFSATIFQLRGYSSLSPPSAANDEHLVACYASTVRKAWTTNLASKQFSHHKRLINCIDSSFNTEILIFNDSE